MHAKLVCACLGKDINEVRAILSQADVNTARSLLSRDISSHGTKSVTDNVIQVSLSMNNIELLDYLVHLEGCDLEQECANTGSGFYTFVVGLGAKFLSTLSTVEYFI